jgi:NAD(P)-dependent dehydrogenase (short-subunit alcohol dehydrogenase family)
LDCLVNNAGYHPHYERIDETSNDMFLELIDTNLVSMYNFCRLSLSHLRKTKGSIVNMSSLVGAMGQKLACRYVSTKGGITSLTKALAVDEAANGVRVNSVSPGCIETPLGEEFRMLSPDPEREKKLSSAFSPMNRVGDIYEVGTVCLFLASEMASFITGADIIVSGGAELAYGIKCEMQDLN